MAAGRAIPSVFADYRIDALVDRGGMGLVYRATELALKRTVALKLIVPELADDPYFRERFKRESKVAAEIEHPNIIPVYETGESEGVLFIAMRYVEGADLATMLASEGALEPRVAADIVAQVAFGLGAAHERNLVHRDVKPANVLIEGCPGGHHVYLTDFGLAKDPDSRGLTKTGHWVGTLDYAAPEQLQGGGVDARTDVYALGCVLYQAVTGQLPYPRSRDVSKVVAHIAEPVPSIARAAPELPAEFDEIVARAMAKDPKERYRSAEELGRAALAAARRCPPSAAQPEAASAADSSRVADGSAPTAG